jgi:hypothetical protein
MVAARRGHVFVLEQHIDGDAWMAYDANSGGAQREFMRAHCVDTPWSIRAQRDYIVANDWK